MEFKNIIYDLRKSRNVSQNILAKELHVSQSTIGMWEIGDRKPSQEKMEEIADYFNVDMDYLYGRQNIERKFALFNPDEDSEILKDIKFKELYSKYIRLTDKQKELLNNLIDDMLD